MKEPENKQRHLLFTKLSTDASGEEVKDKLLECHSQIEDCSKVEQDATIGIPDQKSLLKKTGKPFSGKKYLKGEPDRGVRGISFKGNHSA